MKYKSCWGFPRNCLSLSMKSRMFQVTYNLKSCIVFVSLSCKTSYPRNGNFAHIFYRFWGGSGGQTSTHCTQTPEMVICLVFFTDSGVCVQFLRKRKFMYVFDNYLRLLLVQYLVLYYRESETRKNDVLSSQFE